MEVAPLIPDPEAVALPAHADGEVAAWQRHLHSAQGENSTKSLGVENLFQLFASNSVVYRQRLIL